MQHSNAWWLAKQELKKQGLYILPSLFAIAFMAIVSIATLNIPLTQKTDKDEILFNSLIVDFLFLYGIPFLTIYTREHWIFTTPSKDVFSKRLAFLRSLPFSIQEIVRSRTLLMLFTLLISLTVFFATFYFFPGELAKQIQPLQYLWFSLIWTGYVLFMNSFILFLELGTSGKVYFWTTCLMAIPAILFAIIAFPSGIILWTITLAKNNGPLLAAGSLALGLLGLLLWTRLTERRIPKRDLLL